MKKMIIAATAFILSIAPAFAESKRLQGNGSVMQTAGDADWMERIALTSNEEKQILSDSNSKPSTPRNSASAALAKTAHTPEPVLAPKLASATTAPTLKLFFSSEGGDLSSANKYGITVNLHTGSEAITVDSVKMPVKVNSTSISSDDASLCAAKTGEKGDKVSFAITGKVQGAEINATAEFNIADVLSIRGKVKGFGDGIRIADTDSGTAYTAQVGDDALSKKAFAYITALLQGGVIPSLR